MIVKLAVAATLTLTSMPALATDFAVVGTGDGIEMLQALGASFNSDNREHRVSVPASIGSGGAVAAVGGDRQVLGRIARALTDSEKSQGLVAVPLAKIPAAFFVHPEVGIRILTSGQIASIYAGAVDNWSEVGGPDVKVRVVRREETDSTLTVLRSSMPGWSGLALTSRSKTATTTQDAVETVRTVPGAIGFGPYARGLDEGTSVLKIDGRHPQDPDYPSAVTLSLLYKKDRVDDAAAAFLKHAKSAKAASLLREGGGVPIE